MEELLAGYRGNTRAAYARDLDDFLAYCGSAGVDPLAARRAHVERYLRQLEEIGRAPTTVARRLTAVRLFYDYAVSEHDLPRSPASAIRHRSPRRSPATRALTAEQVRGLLRAADAAGPRWSALIWLLASTGLRISEALNARVSDLRSTADAAVLHVIAKGRLPRDVLLLQPVTARLRRLIGDRVDGPIFATANNRPLDRHNAAKGILQIGRRAGVDGAVRPHALRHTFVTLSRQAGCALEDVQDAVGHAAPSVTRRYDHSRLTADRHPSTVLAPLFAVTASSSIQRSTLAEPRDGRRVSREADISVETLRDATEMALTRDVLDAEARNRSARRDLWVANNDCAAWSTASLD